jgi:Acetate kinase
MLNHDSGLAGLSGTSGDMREVVEAANAGDDRSRLALDVFVHHVRKGIASMAASMNGLDAVVFAGGIGEHAPNVRALIADGLGFLGVDLDADLNDRGERERIISSPGAKVCSMIIPAEENWVIARTCFSEVSKNL